MGMDLDMFVNVMGDEMEENEPLMTDDNQENGDRVSGDDLRNI